MSNTISVHDIIKYRGGFGKYPPKAVIVEGLRLVDAPGMNDGKEVRTVTIEQVKLDHVIFHLNDGHWCYGYQVVLP